MLNFVLRGLRENYFHSRGLYVMKTTQVDAYILYQQSKVDLVINYRLIYMSL